MKRYVIGFLFDDFSGFLPRIRKNRPEWQAGKLNAPGGHIEEGETPLQAMTREFMEETGAMVTDWTLFAVMFDPEFEVHCFFAEGDVGECKTMTDERVFVVNPDHLPEYEHIDNLLWLIPMAQSFIDSKPGCTHYRVEYARLV